MFGTVLATCKKILSISNGQVIKIGIKEGDVVTFVCNLNYELMGEKVLRCMDTGQWNASKPKCKGK